MVRSETYLEDRKKIFSKSCVFRCLCCEIVSSKDRLDNFSARPNSLVYKLREQGYSGFIYVYNIMVWVCRSVQHRFGMEESMLLYKPTLRFQKT